MGLTVALSSLQTQTDALTAFLNPSLSNFMTFTGRGSVKYLNMSWSCLFVHIAIVSSLFWRGLTVILLPDKITIHGGTRLEPAALPILTIEIESQQSSVFFSCFLFEKSPITFIDPRFAITPVSSTLHIKWALRTLNSSVGWFSWSCSCQTDSMLPCQRSCCSIVIWECFVVVFCAETVRPPRFKLGNLPARIRKSKWFSACFHLQHPVKSITKRIISFLVIPLLFLSLKQAIPWSSSLSDNVVKDLGEGQVGRSISMVAIPTKFLLLGLATCSRFLASYNVDLGTLWVRTIFASFPPPMMFNSSNSTLMLPGKFQFLYQPRWFFFETRDWLTKFSTSFISSVITEWLRFLALVAFIVVVIAFAITVTGFWWDKSDWSFGGRPRHKGIHLTEQVNKKMSTLQ